MAGHSKWANIKHRKGRQDEKKQKIFSKLIREITVASKLGGAEASDNPRLRLALDKALGANMPKDTIERAISRGAGDSDSGNLEEITYEGYGPNGVAILIEAMSDNKNRTVAEVRHAFSKCGGSLGTDGSVSYLFLKKGQIIVKESNQEKLLELLISEGIEDIESSNEDLTLIFTEPNNIHNVKNVLLKENIEIIEAEMIMDSSQNVQLNSEDTEKVLKLLDNLEDLDDVQNVFSNAEFFLD
ncbi:MAG: YebC/PmpR family DNA-binding transcriptional regulator [Proteobacteria bacterium]|nr:YebC/PmpR family DNA-binding transcriptional regulator [Pseudomonadota bacterium]RZO99435.1 MAG: YebC/PmpR family DNA-binding transcriptional regulator [Gammaproteobacteria bacterium]|tara:strand:+ start:1879 stop:2604 length:726 start_codon:yes stop_codon:yes gene_type:complete